MNRRGFLKLGLGGSALLAGVALVGRHLGDYPAVAVSLRVLGAKEFAVFTAAAARICVGSTGPSAPEIATFVDGYLTYVPPAVQRDVRSLLLLLEHSQFPRAKFTRLSADAQDAVLSSWQTSALALKRQGFQALKTLAFLGHYRDARTWQTIGYSGPMLAVPTK